MTARADLTEADMKKVRQFVADGGKQKTELCARQGWNINWLNRAAKRTGYDVEINQLLPQRREQLDFTDELANMLRAKASAGIRMREACRQMGKSPDTVRAAAFRAGRGAEFKSIFGSAKSKDRAKEPDLLPRDVCTQVKWLTREWRIAA